MNNVLQVARYIITKMDEPISKNKLQDLVCWSQRLSMAWDKVKLFNEDIEITSNGPICKVLSDKYKDLTLIDKNFLKDINIEGVFNKDELVTMNVVIEQRGDK